MLESTWTYDLPQGDIEKLVERLKKCDGINSDACILTWEHCQFIVKYFQWIDTIDSPTVMNILRRFKVK